METTQIQIKRDHTSSFKKSACTKVLADGELLVENKSATDTKVTYGATTLKVNRIYVGDGSTKVNALPGIGVLYAEKSAEALRAVSANTADSATKATTADTADSATKFGTTTVGSATKPIYIKAGVPTAISYTIGSNVPANAIFTDTKYTAGNKMALSSDNKFHNLGVVSITASNTPASLTVNVGTSTGTTSSSNVTLKGVVTLGSATTVGSISTPVYVNNGAITKCTKVACFADTPTSLVRGASNQLVYTNSSGQITSGMTFHKRTTTPPDTLGADGDVCFVYST